MPCMVMKNLNFSNRMILFRDYFDASWEKTEGFGEGYRAV